ncbi:MAG: hypothetical protein M1834_009203 [Cirrosporium novae-zelandiae]|nr:MAG: hypothetical protein M1834_009203 [Cirrosporium novae-zelandiae]
MAIKYEYLSQPFGIACPTFGRISFAVYMLGLIGPVKWRRWLLHGLIWSQVIVNSVTIILIFVQCEHVDAIWDREGAGGWCWDASVNTDFGGKFTYRLSANDYAYRYALEPQVGNETEVQGHLINQLSSAMIASIVKTVELRGIADRYDFTHNMISFIIWCSVENNIVMISSSIPMIRPLWVRRKGSSYELGTYVSDPSGYGGGTRGRPHTHPDPQTVYASPRVFHKPAAVVTGSGSRSADSPSNSSEENILGTSGHGRNIIKSTTVAVEYDRDDGSHGTGKQVPSYGF